jgi:hydroxypyruvate isomerase
MLFPERRFLDCFDAVAAAGFCGIEYLGPYDFPNAEIASRLKANGLTQMVFNLPAGDWAKGDRGIACHPDRVAEYRASVGNAIDCAPALDFFIVNCFAGIKPPDVTEAEARRDLVDNHRHAADELQSEGIELVVEPINRCDIPGFFLSRSTQILAVIDENGSTYPKLQYSIYHMQRMEGELATTIERLQPRIGHIQIAGIPGRPELDIGEINHLYLLQCLGALGYSVRGGAEYQPRGRTAVALGSLRAWRGSAQDEGC